MASKLPEFRRGDVITAARLTQITRVINSEVLSAPRDLDTGIEEGIRPNRETVLQELGEQRTTSEQRIYQDDDDTSANYVDVERPESIHLINNSTGEVWTLVFANDG